MVWGGGVSSWRREGPPVDATLEPSPAAGGRMARPARSGGGGGAGWRDHLSGDMRSPNTPCLQPPLPRDRGGGYFLCEGGGRGWRGRGILYGLFPALGRSSCGRAAARGCAGVQHVATLGRSGGLSRGAERGRGGAQHAAALGRGVGLCRSAACGCTGGAAWGRAGAQPAAVLGSPAVQG